MCWVSYFSYFSSALVPTRAPFTYFYTIKSQSNSGVLAAWLCGHGCYSQNRTIVGVGRDLWSSSSSTPCYRRFPTVDCTEKHPSRFWICLEKEIPQPLCTRLFHALALKVMKFFLMFICNFLCSIFWPLSFVLSLGTVIKSLTPSICFLAIGYL